MVLLDFMETPFRHIHKKMVITNRFSCMPEPAAKVYKVIMFIKLILNEQMPVIVSVNRYFLSNSTIPYIDAFLYRCVFIFLFSAFLSYSPPFSAFCREMTTSDNFYCVIGHL